MVQMSDTDITLIIDKHDTFISVLISILKEHQYLSIISVPELSHATEIVTRQPISRVYLTIDSSSDQNDIRNFCFLCLRYGVPVCLVLNRTEDFFQNDLPIEQVVLKTNQLEFDLFPITT